MAKIQLEVTSDLHLRIKQLQLKKEGAGVKVNLKELYLAILKAGLTETEKAAS